tara:strand:+ start:909 stop:1034 length:126 start_codon:yes stop_codon:yes gene_type:complete
MESRKVMETALKKKGYYDIEEMNYSYDELNILYNYENKKVE